MYSLSAYVCVCLDMFILQEEKRFLEPGSRVGHQGGLYQGGARTGGAGGQHFGEATVPVVSE